MKSILIEFVDRLEILQAGTYQLDVITKWTGVIHTVPLASHHL